MWLETAEKYVGNARETPVEICHPNKIIPILYISKAVNE